MTFSERVFWNVRYEREYAIARGVIDNMDVNEPDQYVQVRLRKCWRLAKCRYWLFARTSRFPINHRPG
jgi:hypothetical protein